MLCLALRLRVYYIGTDGCKMSTTTGTAAQGASFGSVACGALVCTTAYAHCCSVSTPVAYLTFPCAETALALFRLARLLIGWLLLLLARLLRILLLRVLLRGVDGLRNVCAACGAAAAWFADKRAGGCARRWCGAFVNVDVAIVQHHVEHTLVAVELERGVFAPIA